MNPQIAFMLYVVSGSILMFLFLLLCVRVSVYIEDTCPIRFCVRRQQRKMRKKLIQRILYPDAEEQDGGDFIHEPGENITADLICQPYIYRDANSTGLTGLGRTLESGRPPPSDGTCPSNPVLITNHRIIFRRMFPQEILSHRRPNPLNNPSSVDEINLGDRNIISSNSHPIDNDTRNDDNDDGAGDSQEGLPPAYSNIINLNSITVSIEDESGVGGRHQPPPLKDDLDEPPPPSYDECVKSPPDFN